MSKDARKIAEWAEKLGNKMLHPVLKDLDTTARKKSDEEIMEVCNHMVSVLVHRMVSDALSVRSEEIEGLEDADIMHLVSAKFTMTKLAIESGVTVAFEQAMSEATQQDLEYTCKINRVADPANKLPC